MLKPCRRVVISEETTSLPAEDVEGIQCYTTPLPFSMLLKRPYFVRGFRPPDQGEQGLSGSAYDIRSLSRIFNAAANLYQKQR